MGESMIGLKRSHYCCDVNEQMIGDTVTVMGWVNKRRDLGQLIFISLRDRTGLLQITIDGNSVPRELFEKAESVRGEYVLAIVGKVLAREPGNINPEMKTGKVEVEALELRVLSEAEVPPFQVADTGVGNDLRLKYRYLDLRRPELAANLILRHKAAQATRHFLSDGGFVEIETPTLTKSSPEGARDYLVASRVHPGSFYALPQSPQMFKQLFMIAGFDKYFQLAKCYRDEDLRADRQPEFTQIDVEMSFADEEDIIRLGEGLMKHIMKEVLGLDILTPFPRMTYDEAMNTYGSDKPDIRFGMKLTDISKLVNGGGFMAFDNVIASGGSVRGINASGCAGFSRKQIDALIEFVKAYGAKGLSWITVTEGGGVKTSLSKFYSDEQLTDIVQAFDGKPGDLILICADSNAVVYDSLGALRVEIAKKQNLTDKNEFCFLWVTEFPLLEWSPEDNRFYAKHHPFTSPMEDDIDLLETKPEAARARAYDLVLNGYELGGGSIRIYQRQLQEKMFNVLGYSLEEAQANFGFFMEAFKYGTPPHGGIALGLDRIAMLLTGSDSLRDVIAFPKAKDASCPMTDAPAAVSEAQLKELGIGLRG